MKWHPRLRLAPLSALLALLLAGPSVMANERAFEAEYRAYYGSIRGAQTTFSLSRSGNGFWRWHSRSEPAGMVSMFRDDIITEVSRFSLEAGQIRAQGYHYQHREGGDIRRERRLTFDWDSKKVRYDDDGDAGELSIPDGGLDRFLAQYALMRDLEQGHRPDSYTIVDRDDHFQQALDYRGEERLRTRAGRFTTLRVDMKDADSDRVLAVWLAPELGYLPVQLEQSEPGERTVRMELESTNRKRKSR